MQILENADDMCMTCDLMEALEEMLLALEKSCRKDGLDHQYKENEDTGSTCRF